MLEQDAYLSFSTFPPLGPIRFSLLIKYFESAKKAWEAPHSEYEKIGFSSQLLSKFKIHKSKFNLGDYKKRLSLHKIRVVPITSEDYPERLKQIQDPPFLLYVKGKGNLRLLADISLSMIGARKMTSYGKVVTEKFATVLASSGVTIVSGLALGIDAASHEAALSVQGSTIAVLGNGLDRIYPQRNANLARNIINSTNSLLISEFPLGFPALSQNFPQRNRIVSGISRGVLVVEGAKKSGTLITAAFAARQGREVFAVPGPVTSLSSAAPHFLIKEGAKLVERPEDILEDLNINTKIKNLKAKIELPPTLEEEQILAVLSKENVDIDSLVRIIGLPTSLVLGALTTMELKGIVKNVRGVYTKID